MVSLALLTLVFATLTQQSVALECFVGDSENATIVGGFGSCMKSQYEGSSVFQLWGHKVPVHPMEEDCLLLKRPTADNSKVLLAFSCQCYENLCNTAAVSPKMQFFERSV